MVRFIRWVIRWPLYSAGLLVVLYFLVIHIIPIWNELVAPKCMWALRFSESGVTNIFIPAFLVLIAYAFFDRYKLYEELETSCHLVKAEFEANEHLMCYFEKYFIFECCPNTALNEFNSNIKLCGFRNFHLDRFVISMTHIKPNSSIEQKLNKWRSKTSQTINLLNNWLAVYSGRIQEEREIEEVKIFICKKIFRLREESSGMMDVMNELLAMNQLDEMNFIIRSVTRR